MAQSYIQLNKKNATYIYSVLSAKTHSQSGTIWFESHALFSFVCALFNHATSLLTHRPALSQMVENRLQVGESAAKRTNTCAICYPLNRFTTVINTHLEMALYLCIENCKKRSSPIQHMHCLILLIWNCSCLNRCQRHYLIALRPIFLYIT